MKTGAAEVLGNRYRIVRPLGGGGMKSVYLAEDLKLSQRLCAVAEMIDNFANPDEQQAAIAAFHREADMLASLKEEHIPQIYDKFSEQQSHYLVMEFVEGDTLENRVKAAGGRLSEQETIDIAIEILDTLEYLHSLSPPVIYRDMKPGNVMVTPSGKVKLIDFGIARFFQTSRMTTVGTPGYAPREQYGGNVEARSDLYALAATLHEALSGRSAVPFDFPALTQLRPGTNQHLSGLIAQALADNVGDRVPSAGEFKNRLTAIKAELNPAPLPSIQPSQQQDDRTVPLRATATQPNSQTLVFDDANRASDISNEPTERLDRRRSPRGFAPIANTEEETVILGQQKRSADSNETDAYSGQNDETVLLNEHNKRKGTNSHAVRNMLIGFASIAAIAVAAVFGVNQWNEIQREKALVTAHEDFERQQTLQAAERQKELEQQQALQAQERQKELLLQREAQRRAELRIQAQEAALERRRQRLQEQERQQAQTPAPYSPYPVAQATPGAPNGTVEGAVAAGVAGAVGGVLGGLLGGAFRGGSSSNPSYSGYPSQPYPPPQYPPPYAKPHQYH